MVPRDVFFREFATRGGTVVSWTAPIYILSANFADVLPADEDLMPIDGNPHPMPGHVPPPAPVWGAPPYPVLRWNDGGLQQPPDNGNKNDAAPANEDWPAWNEVNVAENDLVVQGDMPPQD